MRDERKTRRGVEDREECVGGPMCWKTKGSEDVRSTGERGGCSSSEVFTHVDTVAARGTEEEMQKDGKSLSVLQI